jgi:hypothetical protein
MNFLHDLKNICRGCLWLEKNQITDLKQQQQQQQFNKKQNEKKTYYFNNSSLNLANNRFNNLY